MNNIAIIPARCGSKGLKDKNIKKLNGIPLMAYSIKAAIDSQIFDCVHCSTDSEEYAEIARDYGANVPFLRSKINAKDSSNSWDAVIEVLDKYKYNGKIFDTVTLLQPTSPMRTSEHIKIANELFLSKKAKAIISVCEMEHSPLWSNVLPKNQSLDGFIALNNNKQRQSFDSFYRINGAIYMVNTEFLLQSQMIYRKGSFAYIMEKRDSIDIDSPLDFEIAEFLMRKNNIEVVYGE